MNLILKIPKSSPKLLTYHNLKDINLGSLQSDIIEFPWHIILSSENVNENSISVAYFITKCFYSHSPIISVLIKHRSFPWITENVKVMARL